VASIQIGDPFPKPSTYLLALPVLASPISFEQVEERSRNLKDGASSVETIVRSVYRDSFGRLRTERAGSEPSAVFNGVIQIIDPVAGVILVSIESEKVGYRLPLPKFSAVSFANFSLAIDEGAASRKWISRTEHLGTQKIEGVEFEGTRIVETSEDEPWIIKSVEQWHSADLNFLGLVVVSMPNGSYRARIQNVHRVEPDAVLFKIPSGYVIRNLPVADKP